MRVHGRRRQQHAKLIDPVTAELAGIDCTVARNPNDKGNAEHDEMGQAQLDLSRNDHR